MNDLTARRGPRLSIIICSYDRYEQLACSVDAVMQDRSFDVGKMELIVVDNTPSRRRRSLSPPPGARVVVCEQPGLSHSRNTGIEASAGEIVAFVDDDALIQDRWCATVLEFFDQRPDAMACGGKTVAKFAGDGRPNWFYDDLTKYLSCIDWGGSVRTLAAGEWIVGANMAFRSRAFAEYGRFDPALGRTGTATLLSNDENAILRRIGYSRVYYLPGMIAQHMIPDARLTCDWFRSRVFWQAVSDLVSGETYLQKQQAFADLTEAVACAPPECRGSQSLSYFPATADQFRVQLKGIYAQAILLASGANSTGLRA